MGRRSGKRASCRAARRGFAGNLFWLFGPRPLREERLRAYLCRQHRAGRSLQEILLDRSVRELGGNALVWSVVTSPETIRALGEDACEQIEECLESIQTSTRAAI
jgi:hypothetical protein